MIASVGGYLLGSIPFGLLLTKWAGMGDIREVGSGNIGATNVLRTGNKKIAVATLLFDMAKGLLAVIIFGSIFVSTHAAVIAGLAAFIGHCYPVWLEFKGGKGVATYFGITFAYSPAIGVIAGVIWLTSAFLSRYSSLSALITVTLTPLAFLVFGMPIHFFAMALIGALIFWRHKENIERLRQGTESKIGQK
ncbi:MAG: glycerol-3-phosphate 1-O-acyltransferase [Alphaproteobacteria bacterium]|nr:MAG: glycerol-3-phosphate 1-O-acyltransferase [Alphaproteobacteria bacterium]